MADEQSKSPAPVSKWVYPFSGVDDPRAATPKPKEIADPNTYFSVLSMAEDGFYPVGANGLWHGGIHFDGSTAGALMQGQGVRCVADGEVIAYRIDSAYPEVEFEKGKVAYSRGFVLVKHRLQLPPAPKKPAPPGATTPAPTPAPAAAAKPAAKTSPSSASAPAPAPEEPSLVFFSLYMHLIDWAGYRADAKLPRPAYWGDECKRVVRNKAPSLSPYAAPQTEDKGVNVRQAGKGTAQIGWLPPGTAVTLELGNGPWRKIVSVDVGQMEADPLNRADTTAPFGWVFQSELTPAPAEPKTKDAVCVLDKPMAIKAGELIGHLGQYQRHADAGSILTAGDRPLVHIEVFSGEDVKAFLERSRARARELEPSKKTLLVVSKGTKLVVPAASDRVLAVGKEIQSTSDSPSTGDWVKVTEITIAPAEAPTATNRHPKPKITPTGDPFWVERAGAQLGPNGRRVSTRSALDGWTDFPLQQANATGAKANFVRVAAVKTLKRSAADDKGVRWWLVDVDEADGKGNTTGWICEKGNLQSPWDWPGFEIVKESAVKPADLHGKQVVDHKLEVPEDKDNFEAKADRAKEGALFQKLYDVLDTDKDEKLSTAELRAALKKPWLAQTLSRLIVRYESEWAGSMGKWDALDAHMGEFAADWAKEKRRIEDLQWWRQVAGKHGLPGSPEVFHFHVIGSIANFPNERHHPIIEVDNSSVELEFLNYYDDSTIGDADYQEAATILGCEVAAIKAVVMSETGPSGSYFKIKNWDKVPAILFERHYFHRLTGGMYDKSNPDISNKLPGGYGNFPVQYEKLLTAYKLDKAAALKSASWGKFQIMGNNCGLAGFAKVEDFVFSLSEAERNHLKSFVTFINSNIALKKALADRNWLAFAIGYNGTQQRGYDQKMKSNYEKITGK